MPSSPYIPIQKESVQVQIQRLQDLLNRNGTGNVDLWAGYQYIGANIANTGGWDQRLVDWFESAAEINGPGAPFIKKFVFGMNDEYARVLQNRRISDSQNQAVSDNLARTVIQDYINALQGNYTIAPQRIFERDVGSAVTGLGLPTYAWAGGLLGSNFGFNLDPIYTTDIGTALFRQNLWLVNSDTVVGRIVGDSVSSTANSIEKTLRSLRKRFFGISLYNGERLDPLGPGVDGFAAIPGLVNATYTYFKTSVPQQYSVQVLNDDGSPMGPSTYNVFYRVGPTFELQISSPRGTSTLTSNDWTSSGDEANFALSGGGTTAAVKTSARGGNAAQRLISATVNGQDITNNVAVAANLSGVLSNALTRFIAGSDPLAQIAAGTVLQAVGLNLAQAIAQGGIARDITFQLENGATQTVRNNVLFNFGQEIATAFQSAAIGSFSALLTTELGRTLGLNGFGAELFNTAAGTGASAVIGKVIDNIHTSGTGLFDGISLSKVFSNGVPDVLSGALGSFFGAKLGSLVISPTNTEGAILSSVGSSAGAWAASAAGGKLLGGVFQVVSKLGVFGGPFVGAFVGFVLGALIGKLFGKKKPRIPTANAIVNLDLASGYYVLGGSSAANGGNRDLVVNMATSARDILNGLISVVVGGVDIAPNANAPSTQPNQSYGHTGNQIWANYRGRGQQNFADASAAVEYGVLNAIKETRIRGGDLISKRALLVSTATSSVALTGDLQVAADYTTYLQNRQRINQMIQAAPISSFAATWTATLARAADLGLHRFQQSDFFGGLQGFAESFGFGTDGYAYETLVVTSEGADVRISTQDGSAPFELFAGSNNVANPAQSVLITNFGGNVGYTPWSGQATEGNDIWIAAAGGPVTMDDTGTQYYGYWDPYYGYYYQYPVTVSGGDDIFIGSAYNDALYGRAGWDWLDGGAGEDLIDGGDNDDVLLGRAGNDRMLGGSGNDYLAGGDGDDYFFDASRTWGLYGGDGNDTLVGGAGMDSSYGENGDDLFIIDQDGGGTWDALNGQAGSDTISYERFTSGVYVDFAVLGGWSWDPSAKYIYGDSIAGMENVTGSGFDDTIYGDAVGNVLRGLAGNDYLDGRDGDDILEGGAGADYLEGGAGRDMASYRASAAAVKVNLATGLGSAGDATGDNYSSIEGIEGSAYDDELTGSAGDDDIMGGAGDDIIVLTSGNDTIDGGDGRDTLDARDATGAVSIYYDGGYYDPYYGYYPGAGWIASFPSGTTTFTAIEQFVGSRFDDYLAGSIADETFEGGAGNDVLSGGGGSDTFIFDRGAGNDTVYASHDGNNAIIMSSGLNWRDIAITGANKNQQNGNLVVSVRGTGDQAIVAGNFSYVNSGSQAGVHNHSIKTLNVGWVSPVDIDMIDWTPYAADDNSTVVYGAQNQADLIFAYAGDDTIYTAGNTYNYETRGNVVYAGDGTDTIYASYGDDQFIFERGNGSDTLTDQGGDDTIVMGPSVSANDVIYQVVTTSGTSGDWGSSADLYIGIRDENNSSLTASQVADRIRIVGGGAKMVGAVYGTESYNTIEHVRVGGQEIDLTKADIDWTVSYYYDGGWYYPIALDLDGDGIELRSVEGSRIASVEADGTITRMGWLGQDDGFLALDRDGNGVIDRIGEISFVGDLTGAKTDLEGLATYDSNADGKLDASDKRWGEFKIWQDKNQDGFGSKNELVSLDEAGVSSINLKGQLTGFTTADGPDNTVIATTDVVWKDAARTGSAYDVALARLQVRTDDAAKGLADLDATARGKKSDDIESKLRGIQTLTPEQAAAIKDKKSKQVDDGSGGQFYRVETLLENGSAKVRDGLYTIDPKVAKLATNTGRKLSVLDQFADSEWTKAGSTKLGEADMRGADAPFKKSELTDVQKAVSNDARKIVADRKVADDAKGAERTAKDATDAVLGPAPTPPSAQELERLKRNDKFKLLEGAADTATNTRDFRTQQMMETAPTDSMAQMKTSENIAFTPIDESEAASKQPIEPVETGQRSSKAEPTPQGSPPDEQSAEADVYGVVIRAANARLVQALASFGDAPAMMANYQGLNVANDAQAAWLSVDAMPSVQRLASIR